MNKAKISPVFILAILLVSFIFPTICLAQETGDLEETKQLRIAYFEPGPFWLYDKTFKAFKSSLREYSAFTASYPVYMSPGWDTSTQKLEELAAELMQRKDIDLIIAAGTGASRAIRKLPAITIPVIGIAMADPVAAGVIKNLNDSGAENYTTRVIPDRWKNMFRVFHDVVQFNKLGLIYPKGPEGRIYMAVDDAIAVGKELGFEVLTHEIADETEASCSAGLDFLSQNDADAFFIGPLLCFDWSLTDVSSLMNKINNELKLPTFARDGSAFVQGGALMGFASWNFSSTGDVLANMAIEIANGALPGSLDMKDNIEPSIAVNLETAMMIGMDLPIDVLVVADEIYETTHKPDLK